ncbi:hypothetical protein BC831DRAFT_490604 [Entophlyctis helioformis]|nr:hypothetical protein BC831DRAFT_490604 [Entophlyctis helioformis]
MVALGSRAEDGWGRVERQRDGGAEGRQVGRQQRGKAGSGRQWQADSGRIASAGSASNHQAVTVPSAE